MAEPMAVVAVAQECVQKQKHTVLWGNAFEKAMAEVLPQRVET